MIDIANSAIPYDEEPSATPSVGVPQERVDPYTLQIADHIFPAHYGLDFLAGLLHLAEAKQLALPDLGLPNVTDVAVIMADNLCDLAKKIGQSYHKFKSHDTVKKYISVFCCLRLLWKQRHQGGITLYFPLSRPQLPEPSALDQLMDRRKKVRTFVGAIKERLVLLCERINLATLLTPPQPIEPSLSFFASDTPRLILEDVRRIVGQQGRVDPETRKSLLSAIEGVFQYHCAQEISLLLPGKVDSGVAVSGQKSLPSAEEVYLSSSKVDSEMAVHDQESLLLPGKVDSGVAVSGQKSLPSAEEVYLSSSKVDSFSKKVDFKAEVTNVNVSIESILLINVNAKLVIEFLSTIFGEPPKKRGYYYNLQKEHQNPEAWLAAAIDTIVAIHHRSNVKHPGRYFYDRCVALHKGIPPEIADLVSQYRSFTYPQLQEVLQGTPSSKVIQELPNTRRSRAQGITLRIPRLPKDRQGMSRDAIKNLTDMIKANTQTKNMRYEPYRQDDDSGILLIEDWVGCQRWICSLEEWHAIVPTVQRSIWPPKDTESSHVENCYGGIN